MSGNKKVGVTVSEHQYRKLKELAEANEVSISEMLRRLIDYHT